MTRAGPCSVLLTSASCVPCSGEAHPFLLGAVVFHSTGPGYDYSLRLNHSWAPSGFPDLRTIMDTKGSGVNDLFLGLNIISQTQYALSGFLTVSSAATAWCSLEGQLWAPRMMKLESRSGFGRCVEGNLQEEIERSEKITEPNASRRFSRLRRGSLQHDWSDPPEASSASSGSINYGKGQPRVNRATFLIIFPPTCLTPLLSFRWCSCSRWWTRTSFSRPRKTARAAARRRGFCARAAFTGTCQSTSRWPPSPRRATPTTRSRPSPKKSWPSCKDHALPRENTARYVRSVAVTSVWSISRGNRSPMEVLNSAANGLYYDLRLPSNAVGGES